MTVDALLSALPGTRLHVVIDGTPLRDGGVAMRDGNVRLTPATGTAEPYHGRIQTLDGDQLVAAVHDPAGNRMTLFVRLVPDGTNAVTGTLTGRAGGSSDDG